MPEIESRKYIILVGDGMADYPLEALGGRTPLEAARTPHMDRVASCAMGRVKTIPDGMDPGSDVANLSLLGYDPRRFHTGRSPLEAASMGVALKENEVAFRMNLVTLENRSNGEVVMVSHSSGDLTTGEGHELVESLKEEIQGNGITLYPGVAYRHLLVWADGPEDAPTIPPHDVLDQDMAPYLAAEEKDPVVRLIRRSWSVLAEHPVNRERRKKGLYPATSIWPWGQGRPPAMPSFHSLHGLRGGVISAVDLIKGIGVYAGFQPIHVEGATGFLDTNYEGKVAEALKGLEKFDLVLVHVEAPDEAGHAGNVEEKIRAIEAFDSRIVGPVLEGLGQREWDFRVLVASDHFTPIVKRTHTTEPAPFAWARKMELDRGPGGRRFTEKQALESRLFFEEGFEIIGAFLHTP